MEERNKMSVEVIARTYEVSGENTNIDYDMLVLSGKAAGICYMPDDYLSDGVQNIDKALNRVESNKRSGHHSVLDHGHITLLIKTNKMIAMILNSLGVYATSEKSARYTMMNPNTQLENEKYSKWQYKIRELISKQYGSMLKSRDIEKLAIENARYMISVFSNTVMEYTVSYRQLYKIKNYIMNEIERLERIERSSFEERLKESLGEFLGELNKHFTDSGIQNNKNEYLRFLRNQYLESEGIYSKVNKADVIGDSYTINYIGSLAMLAQAQRHRTLRYEMKLKEVGENGYYVPKIIRGTNLEQEWLNDIQEVAYCIPQGTLVKITEQGIFEDYELKVKERLCGRAQLEIMEHEVETMRRFIDNKDKLSLDNYKRLRNITKCGEGLEVCARCSFGDFKCSEGCVWGPKKALTRLI